MRYMTAILCNPTGGKIIILW